MVTVTWDEDGEDLYKIDYAIPLNLYKSYTEADLNYSIIMFFRTKYTEFFNN